MSGITSRTIIPLGGNVRVAAAADLTSDTGLTSAAYVVVGAAVSLAADYALSASPTQSHFGVSTLVAGTACISDEGVAIRMGSSHLTAQTALTAAGGLIVDGAADLVFDLALDAAGGLAFDAGTADLSADLDIDLIDPGRVYTAGEVALTAETSMSTTTAPLFRLILPTGTAVFTRDRLWRRFPIPTGITMLVTSGTVTLKESVSDLELEAADNYYLGGYRHQIAPAERNTIVAAGYGDLIEEA